MQARLLTRGSRVALVALSLSILPAQVSRAATINVPADQPTIQLAVDNASAGDTIAVSAGNYAEQTTISGRRALTIQGSGHTSTTIIAPGVGPAFTVSSSDGITIAGFHLESVDFGGDTDQHGAILVDGSINVTVHHCFITKQAGNGVLVKGASSLHAYENVMVKIGDDGVSYRLATGTGLIHDNTFADNGTNAGIVNGSGIGIWASGGVRIVSFNNISWGNDYGLAQDGSAPMDHDYDLVGGSRVNDYYGMSAGPNDVGCDPAFVNAALNDYHIMSTSCAIDQGTPSYSGNPCATTDIDDAPKPGGAAPEIGADEVGCIVTVSGWQDLFEICAGDTARLNSLVIELPECPETPDRIWTDDGAAPQVRDVSPTTDTTYEVTVTCPSMPDCVVRRTVLVDVDQPPDPFRASSRDVAPCNTGIIVSWDAATFHGPGGSGTYSVHRSQVSCADALARPPLATGLLDIEWVDLTAVPGTPYFYVVVAEDDDAPTTCLPGGPNNGGATTTSCISLAATDEVDTTPPTDPGPAVLRARHVGQQITMLWPTSRALLADEHFHLVKTYGRPVGGWTLANPELDTALSFTETDTSYWLQCFLLRVANACETTSSP